MLAEAVAEGLVLDLLRWNIKSTSKAQDGLYVYDTVQRLNDARFGDRDVSDMTPYIKLGPLGRALLAEQRVVLLIDEVDKADIEFPNDLLHELDRMSFTVVETGETHAARQRPVVVITSNNEKELPDAFLRRCVFHYIDFPERELMDEIVRVHHPDLESELLRAGPPALLLAARPGRRAQAPVDQRADRLDRGAAPRRRHDGADRAGAALPRRAAQARDRRRAWRDAPSARGW